MRFPARLPAGCLVGGLVCCLALTCVVAPPASAQTAVGWPVKPPRVYVGFVPGGFTDIAGRLIGQGLSDAYGVQFIVDNRPGANGAIAAELTARSAPDGYTFYVASPGHTTNPILQSRTRYDPVKDFTPISLFADIPNVLVTNPSVPVRNLQEFLALARRTELTQASSGIGSPGHLVGELMQLSAKVRFIHVPYKGTGALMTDLIGGQVDFSFPTAASALPYVQRGRLRAIGVASPRRSQAYPGVPTIAEAGLRDFQVMGWYGVLGPARMQKELVASLSDEIAKLTRRNDTRAKLLGAGAEPVGSTPEEFAAFLAADFERWGRVIRAAKIAPE
jgi:tripartite-type tricarboxylate transporter receptor subunit TctC